MWSMTYCGGWGRLHQEWTILWLHVHKVPFQYYTHVIYTDIHCIIIVDYQLLSAFLYYINIHPECRQLLNEVLKRGYLLMRFIICLMVGPPGVGKTCLKHLLLDKHPRAILVSALAPSVLSIQLRSDQCLHPRFK